MKAAKMGLRCSVLYSTTNQREFSEKEYNHFSFKRCWFWYYKVLTAASRLPCTYGSIDFSDHWCWYSDYWILEWFSAQASVFWN